MTLALPITTLSGATMPENDVLALQVHYKNWRESRMKGLKNVDPFEFFCADQFLKPYMMTDAEIIWGLVDDKNDGGVDAFYFLLNRVPVDDNTDVDPRATGDVHLVIMQVKESKGFSPINVDKLYFFTDDLLHIGRQPHEYHTTYHEKLANLMRIFKEKYAQMAGAHPNLFIDYYFITGSDAEPNVNANNSGRSVCDKAQECFPKAEVRPFHFINATRLWEQVQIRPLRKKRLKFETSFDSPEGWAGLVSLLNFYDFIKDDTGETVKLNESFLEENVRGYQLDSPVNKKITTTLETLDSPEFWMLNNGITILTPIATPSLGGQLEINDPQIVNGLQTSRKIFDYYSNPEAPRPAPDNRRILVKVIQTSDVKTRDEIIRATNDQNKMPAEALISTYRIQRQIEDYFRDNGLYYDRRKGHWKSEGVPAAKIVDVIELVQAVVSIVIQRPDDARGRPRDYIKQAPKRHKVFGSSEDEETESGEPMQPLDLEVYLQCVKILRKVDDHLADRKDLDTIVRRNVRFYMAQCAAAAAMDNAYVSAGQLKKLDVEAKITDELLTDCFKRVNRLYLSKGGDDDAAKNIKLSKALLKSLINAYSPPNKTKQLFEM